MLGVIMLLSGGVHAQEINDIDLLSYLRSTLEYSRVEISQKVTLLDHSMENNTTVFLRNDENFCLFSDGQLEVIQDNHHQVVLNHEIGVMAVTKHDSLYPLDRRLLDLYSAFHKTIPEGFSPQFKKVVEDNKELLHLVFELIQIPGTQLERLEYYLDEENKTVTKVSVTFRKNIGSPVQSSISTFNLSNNLESREKRSCKVEEYITVTPGNILPAIDYEKYELISQ